MLPSLLQLGPVHISSYGVFVALAFFMLAYMVWKWTHDRGFAEEKVFDNLVVTSIFAFLGARIYFAVTHWDLFAPSILRFFLMWRFPGLSLLGALVGGLGALFIYGKQQKLAIPVLWDAYGNALPWVMMFISFGYFLDGTIVGKETTLPTGLPHPGLSGNRHPVALYALVIALLLGIILQFLKKWLVTRDSPKGQVGWMALVFLGLSQFILAFFRADLIYWDGLSISHIVYGLLTCAAVVVIALQAKFDDDIVRLSQFVIKKIRKL